MGKNQYLLEDKKIQIIRIQILHSQYSAFSLLTKNLKTMHTKIHSDNQNYCMLKCYFFNELFSLLI